MGFVKLGHPELLSNLSTAAEYTTIMCRKFVKEILKRDSWNAVVFFRCMQRLRHRFAKVFIETLSQIGRLILR